MRVVSGLGSGPGVGVDEKLGLVNTDVGVPGRRGAGAIDTEVGRAVGLRRRGATIGSSDSESPSGLSDGGEV